VPYVSLDRLSQARNGRAHGIDGLTGRPKRGLGDTGRQSSFTHGFSPSGVCSHTFTGLKCGLLGNIQHEGYQQSYLPSCLIGSRELRPQALTTSAQQN